MVEIGALLVSKKGRCGRDGPDRWRSGVRGAMGGARRQRLGPQYLDLRTMVLQERRIAVQYHEETHGGQYTGCTNCAYRRRSCFFILRRSARAATRPRTSQSGTPSWRSASIAPSSHRGLLCASAQKSGASDVIAIACSASSFTSAPFGNLAAKASSRRKQTASTRALTASS